MRNGVFPAISINKDIAAISDSSPEENNTCYPAAIKLHLLPTAITEDLGEGGCENRRILAPDSRDEYERNDFREPRSCIFPYIEER